jgi:hypothetical protein
MPASQRPASTQSPPAERAARSSPFTYTPPEPVAPARKAAATERRCKYCCTDVPPQAKKCYACGEWMVGTSSGFAAALLRLLGWTWALLSCFTAATIWYVGTAIRDQLIFRGAAEYLTPFGVDLVVWAVAATVLLQGFTVGVGLNVLARLAPRRPRWWS